MPVVVRDVVLSASALNGFFSLKMFRCELSTELASSATVGSLRAFVRLGRHRSTGASTAASNRSTGMDGGHQQADRYRPEALLAEVVPEIEEEGGHGVAVAVGVGVVAEPGVAAAAGRRRH